MDWDLVEILGIQIFNPENLDQIPIQISKFCII